MVADEPYHHHHHRYHRRYPCHLGPCHGHGHGHDLCRPGLALLQACSIPRTAHASARSATGCSCRRQRLGVVPWLGTQAGPLQFLCVLRKRD